jgi:hypothetical protein
VERAIKDTTYRSVLVHRYLCQECGHTFRVYPKGVTHEHTSQRVKGLAIALNMLGLSYSGTSQVLDRLGVYLSRSRIHDLVQEIIASAPELAAARGRLFDEVKRLARGKDVAIARRGDRWLSIAVKEDSAHGLALVIGPLAEEDATPVREWLAEMAGPVGAKTLMSQEAQPLTTAARDQLSLREMWIWAG